MYNSIDDSLRALLSVGCSSSPSSLFLALRCCSLLLLAFCVFHPPRPCSVCSSFLGGAAPAGPPPPPITTAAQDEQPAAPPPLARDE